MKIDLHLIPPTATSQENKTAVVNGRIMHYKMSFKLKMTPPTATAQQKGERIVGERYIHHYKKKRVADAEAILKDALLPFVPETPITGVPIMLFVCWCFPYPKSAKKHIPGWARFKITRPDTDNLNKMLKDCMTDMGFWKDDALIANESVMKIYADEPGIEIAIREMPLDLAPEDDDDGES